MRISSIIFVMGYGISALAQPAPVANSSAARNAYARVVVQNRIEPPPPPGAAKTIQPGLMVGPDLWFHRYLTDSSQKKYLGYDLRLDQSGTDALQITFQPLSETPSTLNLGEGWSAMRLSSYPAPQIVNNGDIVAIDLMINPATGQKIVDYLLVRCDTGSSFSRARDFTAADAELRITAPRLKVNGKSFETASAARDDSTVFRVFAEKIAGLGDVGADAGGDPWFYFSGHGRFVFSLRPREGYQKVGEVVGNTLSFSIAGNKYVLSCKGPIAPGSDTYNLYVLHEPAYKPKGADRDATFLHGAGR